MHFHLLEKAFGLKRAKDQIAGDWVRVAELIDLPAFHEHRHGVTQGREGKLIYLLPDNSLQEAVEIFQKNGISQLPVFENGHMAGAVQEITIMRALRQQGAASVVPLRAIMAQPMPQVDSRVPLEEVYRLLLAGNTAVVVTRDGRLAGLITRSDLMEYYAQSPTVERP